MLEISDEVTEQFDLWVRFLNNHSLILTALTANTPLNVYLLRHVYTTTITASSDNVLGFTVVIRGKTVRVTRQDLSKFLELPIEDFDHVTNDAELNAFFYEIGCSIDQHGNIPKTMTII